MFKTRSQSTQKRDLFKPILATALFCLEDRQKINNSVKQDPEEDLLSPRNYQDIKISLDYSHFGELIKPTPFQTYTVKTLSNLPTRASIASTSTRSRSDIMSPNNLRQQGEKLIREISEPLESPPCNLPRSILKSGEKSRFT